MVVSFCFIGTSISELIVAVVYPQYECINPSTSSFKATAYHISSSLVIFSGSNSRLREKDHSFEKSISGIALGSNLFQVYSEFIGDYSATRLFQFELVVLSVAFIECI